MDTSGLLKDLGLVFVGNKIDPSDEADILRYANEARCLIQSLNPDHYASSTVIKLEAGGRHVVCECEKITRLLGQTSEDCQAHRPLNFGQFIKCAKPEFEFIPRSIKLTVNSNIIHVYPSIPEGKTVFLEVNCQKKLEDFETLTNFIDCADSATLVHYIMYRKSMTDADSADSIAVSNVYLKTFAELIGVRVKAINNELSRFNTDNQ